MINLELYRVFYEVALASNITKASINLRISQPAVTKHIKNLEDVIGESLFIRNKKGVILTEAGMKLFIKVKQALLLISEAEKEVKDIKELESGTIKIGTSTTIAKKYLLKYIEAFHKKYPKVIIEISTDPTIELIKSLKIGMIDLVIAKLPLVKDSELEFSNIGKLNSVFIVNKDYIDLTKKKLNINDILSYPILLQKEPSNSRELIDKYCLYNNIAFNTAMNIASSNLLVDFVKIGYGIGIATKEYISDELSRKELFVLDIEPKLDSTFLTIISLKNNVLSSSSKKFIDFIKKDFF